MPNFEKIDCDSSRVGVLYDGEWREIIVAGEKLFSENSFPRRFKFATLHLVSDRYLLTIRNTSRDEAVCYSTGEAMEIVEPKKDENFFDF